MTIKTPTIKRQVEEARQEQKTKEAETRLAELIRENLDNTLGQQLVKLSECVFALQQATEKVQKEISEKQTVVEKQKIEGKVTIANPKAVQTKKVDIRGKVEVTNQVDLSPLKEGIRDVLKIASDIMNENSKEHTLELTKMFSFLKALSEKQNRDLLRALVPLQYLSDHAQKPLSVRLSDGEKFYKAIATLGQQIYAASQPEHTDYKAYDLTVTGTEQEVDLGGIYKDIAIANGVVAAIEVKLNSNTNDIIVLDKQGTFAHDSFRVEKIYLKSQAGSTPVTIFVSRPV